MVSLARTRSPKVSPLLCFNQEVRSHSHHLPLFSSLPPIYILHPLAAACLCSSLSISLLTKITKKRGTNQTNKEIKEETNKDQKEKREYQINNQASLVLSLTMMPSGSNQIQHIPVAS